jgi:hypothetical protein
MESLMMRHKEWKLLQDVRVWMVLAGLFCGGCLLPPPAVVPIATVPNTAALETTSGNKLAVANGLLHLVYLDGASLKYTTSADAQNWSAPFTLSTSASDPSIAATQSGVVGVVYVQGGSLLYRHRTSSSAWSAPFGLSSFTGGTTSLAAYGNRMYAAWSIGTDVLVGNFAASSPTALPKQNTSSGPGCNWGASSAVSHPTISVGPQSPSNTQPRVRVAYFSRYDIVSPLSPCGPPSTSFGLIVVEESFGAWIVIYQDYGTVTMNSNDGGVSASLAALPGGEFFLAYSMSVNSVATTTFVRLPTTTWSSGFIPVLLSQTRALVHVAPITAPCSYFRLTVSDVGSVPAVYAPTWYREGSWVGYAPVWSTPPVPVTPVGRNAQSVQWSRHYGSPFAGYTRRLRSVFGTVVGTSQDAIEATYEDVPGPEPACAFKTTPGGTKS